MNTTIQALQALYVKLGGSLTDTYGAIASGEQVGNYTTIPDMIEACVQKTGSGGGSALPAVTAEDNDKVLTVVNGAWDKAESGGAEDYDVTFAISTDGGMSVTGDHTAQEILTAYNQGKNIKATASISIEGNVMTFIFYLGNISSSGVMLYSFGVESGLMRIDGEVGASGWTITSLN